MPISLYESKSASAKEEKGSGTSIVTGTVVNNCDLIRQGKVLVRIPSLDLEVWARLCAPGGGSGAGFFYTPRLDDEVLVGMNQNDPTDAFVLGGLWSTTDPPPVTTPVDAVTKRVLRTGLTAAVGHEVEFDDALQSISIVTSTKQKITIDPLEIKISNTLGTLSISLDNKTQTVKISGVQVVIDAKARVAISAPVVEIKSKLSTTVSSNGSTMIRGTPVAIN